MITGRRGGWLPDDWRVTMLELVPLTDEQTDALILTLDPTVNLDQCAAVRARCDGVPFYVEQVVAGLARRQPMPRKYPRLCMSRCSLGYAPARTPCRSSRRPH